MDFNPYAPRTNALLFTYAGLAFLSSAAASSTTPPTPVLRVIDSQGYPYATRNAPEHQHNMAPLEALTSNPSIQFRKCALFRGASVFIVTDLVKIVILQSTLWQSVNPFSMKTEY